LLFGCKTWQKEDAGRRMLRATEDSTPCLLGRGIKKDDGSAAPLQRAGKRTDESEAAPAMCLFVCVTNIFPRYQPFFSRLITFLLFKFDPFF
jgi:hypothetical protein